MAQFQKGNKLGKGRVGPNKLNSDVKEMIQTALTEAGGAKYLLAQAKENPTAFMSLVGKLVPISGDLKASVTVILGALGGA